ncbi:polysaccharide deacetylase family protein [Sulfurovum sp. ST-21]|uniref:Polysaccharide deacetylase family protein n=1 Tax=Sulfurovum indicum TaxID=2779528 RepID=A0A7M1S3D7_9BACT|nr:polysaccharide deacetylase family protein [Sulfurovum indicum]QOR61943.1 polysaccharide deacetylase family protein [Sulfurovum indicum]
MICLTADLHHMSLKTGNQLHSDRTEMSLAGEFVKMMEARDIKGSFFITGRSFEEEWDEVKPIVESPNIEVGGHTYEAFKPELLHRVWNKLTKNYNGPYAYQYYDTKKTIDIIYKKTGKRINIWRNHMYMHGPNTEKILKSLGIDICSDGVKKENFTLQKDDTGLYNLPINIIPDHEHIIHAERTPEWIAQWQKRYNWSDDFGPDSYYIDTWAEMVLDQLKENEAKGRLSVMIIHPITMYLADGFKAVQKILDYIQTRETIFMGDLLPKETKAAA